MWNPRRLNFLPGPSAASASYAGWGGGGAAILAAHRDDQHDVGGEFGHGANEHADSLVDALLDMDIDATTESNAHTAHTARTGEEAHAAKSGAAAGFG